MGDCPHPSPTPLMQDRLYRMDVVTAAMGYFQVPMTSYDLGKGK